MRGVPILRPDLPGSIPDLKDLDRQVVVEIEVVGKLGAVNPVVGCGLRLFLVVLEVQSAVLVDADAYNPGVPAKAPGPMKSDKIESGRGDGNAPIVGDRIVHRSEVEHLRVER